MTKSLKEEHLQAMKDITSGATIFSYSLAMRLREVERFDSELIDIIHNLDELEAISGEVFPAEKKLPYFGAILTKKGKEYLNNHTRGVVSNENHHA
ncbi:TPA: hypothetical protein ACGBET_003577 [Bacillus cereus]